MAFKTWAVGEEVLAADFNSYVQRQVVAVFANAAARDAAIPAPANGQCCFLADTDTYQIYTDKTPSPSWRQPWSQPWGRALDQAASDTVFTTSTVIVPSSGFVFPVQGRKYLVTYNARLFKFNDVVGTVSVDLNSGTAAYRQGRWSLSPNFNTQVYLQALVSSTASVTGGLVNAICDSGQAQLLGGVVSLDDVGPAV